MDDDTRRLDLLGVVVAAAALFGGGCAGGSDPTAIADPAAPAVRVAPPPRRTLLIVHAPHLAESAAAWSAYRSAGGWAVVCEAYRKPEGPVIAPHLQARIRTLAGAHGPDGFHVLLLGDAPDGVPTWYFLQKDATMREPGEPFYASDHPYRLLDDDDELPDIALGRVPARSDEEALALLAKIRRHEARPSLGPWRRHITYVAGEGHYGAVDVLMESLFEQMLRRLVPASYDVSLSYAKATSPYCPPPSGLTETVLGQLGSGALLFNYVGHGSARRFDALEWSGRRIPILETTDLDRLEGDPERGGLALLTCGSAGWYDLSGGEPSLGEAMLFNAAGPMAVIAGSRNTHPYANAVLQKEVTQALVEGRSETAGALVLAATRALLVHDQSDVELDALATPVALLQRWPSSLGELRLMHARLYNLLGDPALQVSVPRPGGVVLERDGPSLAGRVDGMARGEVLVTLETGRASPARPEAIVAVGADDPDLDAKAAANYVLANERVLLQAHARVRDGRFAITLAEPIPSNAALIKAYAWGADAGGSLFDAVGSLGIKGTVPF